MSSFRHARALKRVSITHLPAIGLAFAAVAVAVTPLTASASTTPAAATTVKHAVVQHTAAPAAKKVAETKKSTATTVTAVAAKATAKPVAKPVVAAPAPAPKKTTTPAVVAAAKTTTVVPAKPYAGVSYSSLEPTGTAGSQQRFSPDSDQWNNATAIVNAAHDMGMSPYAATIAVATALQESTLHNLNYGDRDSLGLFQQRPSMGWGTPAELTDPTYAAKAFLRELPSGYENMNLADAAQSVQRSFDGSLYAQWEDQAAYMVHAIAS